jgi:surfactin synthase thioesterase subunit/glycosyltransferase involved in cell wall biosynthesis
MKILLAHNSLYFPSHGGGDKSNRLLMEALAQMGHAIRVVARVEEFGEPAHHALTRQLDQRAVSYTETQDLIQFTRNGVSVRTLTRSPHIRAYFAAQIEEWDPDIIVTSTDDPGQLLFSLALKARRARVVYLIRATIAAPFGPDSSSINPERAALLQQADGVVGVSEYVAGYARRWGALTNAIHVPISLMEPGASGVLGHFTNPYVTMVNPCAVKGISIFLGLAERMPHLPFAAVPTWGTTPQEFAAMRALPNVTLLPPVDDITEILRQTRVMLVPSVWAEARSRMVMEAMLSAIPVIASDVGGLREAKLGVPYLLPVQPVTHYKPSVDRNMVPIAEVPPQDTRPWEAVVHRLTADEPHWAAISASSRQAALAYLEQLTAAPFEAYLRQLLSQPKKQPAPPAGLSIDKKRLLALKLKQRPRAAWFPRCSESATPRLFCFPHAGAGTLAYRNWIVPSLATCPALLPGREDRAAEPAFEQMPLLINALLEAVRPLISSASVFFGHSMGAGIAFELARALRRTGGILPGALVVSGAKPPQYRLNRPPQPDPTDEELAAQIRALSGSTDPIQEDLIQLALPVLRSDTRLYRNYSYSEEPPLPIPIYAYCGTADPNVSPEQMADWASQTSASFHQRTFPGGHFYLRELSAAVLESLTQDLTHDLTPASS